MGWVLILWDITLSTPTSFLGRWSPKAVSGLVCDGGGSGGGLLPLLLVFRSIPASVRLAVLSVRIWLSIIIVFVKLLGIVEFSPSRLLSASCAPCPPSALHSEPGTGRAAVVVALMPLPGRIFASGAVGRCAG